MDGTERWKREESEVLLVFVLFACRKAVCWITVSNVVSRSSRPGKASGEGMEADDRRQE